MAFSLVYAIKLSERSNIAQVSLVHSSHLPSWLAELSELRLINVYPQASRETQKPLDGLRSPPLEFASLSLIKELFDTSNECRCELPESVNYHISKLRWNEPRRYHSQTSLVIKTCPCTNRGRKREGGLQNKRIVCRGEIETFQTCCAQKELISMKASSHHRWKNSTFYLTIQTFFQSLYFTTWTLLFTIQRRKVRIVRH